MHSMRVVCARARMTFAHVVLQPFAKYIEEESPKFAQDARYSKGLVRYKDLKDHIKNMQKSKYERDIQARRNKPLTGLPEPASLRR